jgi:transposase
MPHLAGVVIEGVCVSGSGVCIDARVRAEQGVCPGCRHSSARVHSRYRRQLADAPVAARAVVLGLRVRRFFCDNQVCPARTFVEQVEGLTSPHARRTRLLERMLGAIGLALAGRAGARLAAVLGMVTSRDSLLRLVRALPDPPIGPVEVLGVDDFALRRGQVYGTVLLDILTHRPLDLIEERTSTVLAHWLGKRPEVKAICRDRSGAYAEGARLGAPQAIQVADRYHLWANLGEAVEQVVLAHRACLAEPIPEIHQAQADEGSSSGSAEACVTAAGAAIPAEPAESELPSRLVTRTRERHAAVATLRDQGYSLNKIGRELGLAFRTVQRFARAATADELLEVHRNRSGKLDPFKPYLHQRWNAGVTQASVLYTELVERGWSGGLRTVQRYLRRFRDPNCTPRPAPPVPVKATSRRVTGWIMTHPEHLSAGDQVRLKQILARCPELEATARHVTAFATMMIQRTGTEQLPAWLDAVAADDLPALHRLVASLRRDHAAVTNGLTLDYSSGQVEGTINRIKMIKRQMFGRANFDLLRKRVLLTP